MFAWLFRRMPTRDDHLMNVAKTQKFGARLLRCMGGAMVLLGLALFATSPVVRTLTKVLVGTFQKSPSMWEPELFPISLWYEFYVESGRVLREVTWMAGVFLMVAGLCLMLWPKRGG